ncbi:MAG: hypothetical protein QY331_08605 [Melioribacteraceae bacterium]|nr:MAG: hypothetical protein QY331_08605 [Melioribacteraceae bacterium]
MENQTKFSKLIIYLTCVFFTIFIGSYLVKIGMINQFFEAETMSIKPIFEGVELKGAFLTMLPVFSISVISFICFILFLLAYVVVSKINFRNEGWFFIITLLIIVTTPFELYLLLQYDINLIQKIFSNDINSIYLLEMLKQRIVALGPFPLIILFSYFIIIFLAIFKPLRKRI